MLNDYFKVNEEAISEAITGPYLVDEWCVETGSIIDVKAQLSRSVTTSTASLEFYL